MKDDEILHKWVNDELTDEELEVFKLRPEYDSLVDLYKNTESFVAPVFDDDAMLDAVLKTEKSTPAASESGRRVFLKSWMKYAVAAASIVLLAVWFLRPNNSSDALFEMAKGERTEGALPDGSTFVVNAESTLRYNSDSWTKDRSLQLHGEAFFEVKKGSKFTVNTPTGIVQVLGTQFNVWSRKNLLEVKCTSGKVAVLSASGTLLDELTKGQALRIKGNKVSEKWSTKADEKASWLKGISKLRKVPLQTVVDELSRQYDVTIDASKVDTKVIMSCNFQHKDLDLALKTSFAPLDIIFEKRDGVVYLMKK